MERVQGIGPTFPNKNNAENKPYYRANNIKENILGTLRQMSGDDIDPDVPTEPIYGGYSQHKTDY